MALWLRERHIGRTAKDNLFTVMRHKLSVLLTKAEEEQQCITGVMTDAPWIVLSRNGTFRGSSVLQQQFDSKNCKLDTIEPTGKESSLQHRPKVTPEHSKVT